MNNSQEQKPIPLQLKDGEKREATKNGNNVAWLCVCGYHLPLIWSGYLANRNNKPQIKNATCRECSRVYTGEVDSKMFPTKIIEV